MLQVVLKQDPTWMEQLEKLKEEFLEVIQADSKENFAEELEDLKQVIIGLQFILEQRGIISMEESNKKHIEKLISRGWDFNKVYSIEEWKNDKVL